MDRPLTSEEKLLAIIRKKKNPSAPTGKKEEAVPDAEKSQKGEQRSLNVFPGLLRFWNRVAVIIAIGLAGFFLIQVTVNKQTTTTPGVGFSSGKEKKEAASFTEKEVLQVPDKPLNFYLSQIQTRDLFLAPWEKQSQSAMNGQGQVNLNEELKVTGIVLDKDPKVIVEDVKAGQTFFLSRGESAKGAQLIEVHEDRAVFLYNGQKVELFP